MFIITMMAEVMRHKHCKIIIRHDIVSVMLLAFS